MNMRWDLAGAMEVLAYPPMLRTYMWAGRIVGTGSLLESLPAPVPAIPSPEQSQKMRSHEQLECLRHRRIWRPRHMRSGTLAQDNVVGEIDRPPGRPNRDQQPTPSRWIGRARTHTAWLLVLFSSAAVIAWVVIVFTVSSARFVVFAPRAKTGFEVLVALLALFAALILFLFPAEHLQHRMSWLALGFFILGVGGLAFGYILPLLNGEENLNAALYETLAVRTVATLSFAIGLATAHPPRVPWRVFLLAVPLLGLAGVLLGLEAQRLPALSHLASVESVAETSRTTMPGLTAWHWGLSLLPFCIALVAVYGAARHATTAAFGGWLIVAMVLLAGSQLHSMFWPGAYSPILTTSSLLRAGFTIIVAVGAVLALVRISAEREKMLATERAYAARLLDLGRLRASFAAMVAHELGNPLTAIDRSIDLMAVDPLTPLQEKARATLMAETRLMTALLADMRGAADAEHDDFAIHPIPVSLDLLMADAAAYARALSGDRPVIVSEAPSVRVLGDPERIAQVLRNLLGNAAKFSPPGAPVELRATMDGRRVLIEVADRGAGVHPDDVSRIFEKFGRGRSHTGTGVAGVGLGLYVSRQILRAHGSDLTFRARPEGGAIFGFELELA